MNSTEKVLWLLKRLGEPPYAMTLTMLSEELACGRSGVYKLLSPLVKNSYVVQNQENKKYSLGPSLYRLGMIYADLKGIAQIAHPIMRKLSAETCEMYISQSERAIIPYYCQRLKAHMQSVCWERPARDTLCMQEL